MALVLDGNGTMTVGNGDITGITRGAIEATAIGSGAVLQVVNATVTGDTTTTSTSYGSTGLFATITPTSTSSKIICLTSSNISFVGSTGGALYIAFYRGTSGNGSGSSIGANPYYWIMTNSNTNYQPQQMMFVDSPASTSALTYTVMHRSSNGGVVGYVNGFASANLGTLILMEIAG
jgi:hypothetical protein